MKPAQELLSIAKPQNLKAIHNLSPIWYWFEKDVINHKTTKFESNSQPYLPFYQRGLGCYQSQNYKIWKQFATGSPLMIVDTSMLSITKLQNLKAIHNRPTATVRYCRVVINHKTTKFESNSQHAWNDKKAGIRCYQSQNYKIWKQFTTRTSKKSIWGTMLSIIKLQNLKAIHNYCQPVLGS